MQPESDDVREQLEFIAHTREMLMARGRELRDDRAALRDSIAVMQRHMEDNDVSEYVIEGGRYKIRLQTYQRQPRLDSDFVSGCLARYDESCRRNNLRWNSANAASFVFEQRRAMREPVQRLVVRTPRIPRGDPAAAAADADQQTTEPASIFGRRRRRPSVVADDDDNNDTEAAEDDDENEDTDEDRDLSDLAYRID